MTIVIDKLQNKPMLHDHPIKLVESDPSNVKEGSLIINTTDNKIKVMYDGTWQVLHTLTLTGDTFVFENDDVYLFENGSTYVFQA